MKNKKIESVVRMNRLAFFLATILIIVIFPLVAPRYCVAQSPLEKPQQRSSPGALPEKPFPTISMDFQNANLKDVLKIFSQQSGLNFIANEEVKERKITLYLDGVSVQDALDNIIKANNLTYEQAEGSNIFIVKESRKPEIEMETRVFRLNYAPVESGGITEAIKEIKTSYGSFIVDGRTNSLVVTDIPEQFPLIERTIADLDSRPSQVMIEVEMLETSLATVEKLGITWGEEPISFGGPARQTDWPLPKHLTLPKDTRTITLGELSMEGLTAVLKMIETDTETKYLARPKILALNGETAEINISSNSVVSVRYLIEEETGRTYAEPERLDIGVSLKVTPQINREDYVTMLIEPAVSEAVASSFQDELGNVFVDPYKRSAKTSVMVKDGETIVIGGLISRDDTRIKGKVPFFSSLPLLGALFERKDDNLVEKELIIFITPHIVRGSESFISEGVTSGREQEPYRTQEEEIETVLDQLEGA